MSDTKELIKKYKIRPTKSLGQNFLIDRSVVKQIVDAAEVDENDLVIEIGPGTGSMTVELAERAGKVIAVEIDRYLIPVLTDSLKDYKNIEIINADVLKVNIKEVIEKGIQSASNHMKLSKVKVVANLPYYITTPIIMKLLEEEPGIDLMVFMVQKEVADRMIAAPGGKDYGALSVAVQYYSKPEKALNVAPHCFIPQPEVDSTVIKLVIYKEPPVELESKKIFFKVVKASFGQRRKTLVNALCNSGFFMENKEEMKDILKNLGIGENSRGETLSINKFAGLANSLFKKNS